MRTTGRRRTRGVVGADGILAADETSQRAPVLLSGVEMISTRNLARQFALASATESLLAPGDALRSWFLALPTVGWRVELERARLRLVVERPLPHVAWAEVLGFVGADPAREYRMLLTTPAQPLAVLVELCRAVTRLPDTNILSRLTATIEYRAWRRVYERAKRDELSRRGRRPEVATWSGTRGCELEHLRLETGVSTLDWSTRLGIADNTYRSWLLGEHIPYYAGKLDELLVGAPRIVARLREERRDAAGYVELSDAELTDVETRVVELIEHARTTGGATYDQLTSDVSPLELREGERAVRFDLLPSDEGIAEEDL